MRENEERAQQGKVKLIRLVYEHIISLDALFFFLSSILLLLIYFRVQLIMRVNLDRKKRLIWRGQEWELFLAQVTPIRKKKNNVSRMGRGESDKRLTMTNKKE